MTTTFPGRGFRRDPIDPRVVAELHDNARELARDTFRSGFWLVVASATLWWMVSLMAGWNSGLL